jgi:hypothetical protein
MADNTEQQFQEANVAIDRTVAAFFIKIESMSGKWDAVAGNYIIEGVVLRLCDEIAKLIDHPDFAKHNMSPAMMKLSNALADFRDVRWEER